MKKMIYSVIALFVLLVLASTLVNQFANKGETQGEIVKEDPQVPQKQVEPINGKTISLYEKNGRAMFSLKELGDKFSYEWRYYPDEGAIDINDGINKFHMLKDTPTVSKNGVYLPVSFRPYIDSSNKVFLPTEMLDAVFEIKSEAVENQQELAVFANNDSSTKPQTDSIKTDDFEKAFPTMTEDEISTYLSFLKSPLTDAHISIRDSHLPSAPRTYRNGFHEGIDWYGGATGIVVDKSTPIHSMGDGLVVRADYDYVEYTQAEREEQLEQSQNMDHTPQYILDKLRGRTVWVQYPKGVLVRYAHLSKIEEGIEVGKKVKTGDILGYVGNSGTSDGVLGNNQGLHLHSDILIYDHLFWEHLNQQQVRSVLEMLFPVS